MNRNPHSRGDHEFALGEVRFAGQQSSYAAKVDRAALLPGSRPELYLLSVIASDSVLKAIRATLSGTRSGMKISFYDLDFVLPTSQAIDLNRVPVSLPSKYAVKHTKLGYGLLHAIFLSKDEDFVPNVTEETVWRKLNSPRFSTPILRGWMPWIVDELLAKKNLIYLYGHRCRCALLDLDSEELDGIVSLGVRLGQLRFSLAEPEGSVRGHFYRPSVPMATMGD